MLDRSLAPSDWKKYKVTLDTGESVILQADKVIQDYDSLIFRVKRINVGRFPAATTVYHEVRASDSDKPEPTNG